MGFPPFRERRPSESRKMYDDAKAAYRADHMVKAQNERDANMEKQDPIEMFKRNFDCNGCGASSVPWIRG